MQKNVVTPFYCIFNLLQISSQTYLTRFIISNANIIPKEEVTSCGQLDTNNIAFTIFGGSWNKEKNNEYPPNRTPAFTNAATMISKSFGLCCNQCATNT